MIKEKESELDKEREENLKIASFLKENILEIEHTKSQLYNEGIKLNERSAIIEKKEKYLDKKISEVESLQNFLKGHKRTNSYDIKISKFR